MSKTPESELLELTVRLLQSIDTGDWATYSELCEAEITCFEPEAAGHLVVGLPFHKFYFDLPGNGSPRQSSVSSPRVRIIGDVAVVCYVRVIQILDASGSPVTACANETRLWQRIDGQWKHIHFHRSDC